MPKLKISAADMVARARARIKEVETVDAIKMLDDPDVIFVDLRDIRERVATLNDMGFAASHLKDGFGDWTKAGGPIDTIEKP